MSRYLKIFYLSEPELRKKISSPSGQNLDILSLHGCVATKTFKHTSDCHDIKIGYIKKQNLRLDNMPHRRGRL